MEASHHQKRVFFKGIAKSFSRVTRRTTTYHQQCENRSSSKVSPSPTSNTYSGGQNLANNSTSPKVCTYSYTSSKPPITSFHEQRNVEDLIPSSMQKVSNYASFKPPSFYDQNAYANKTWGRADENVDSKATSYISIVKERFKLDRVDSTRNKYQEML